MTTIDIDEATRNAILAALDERAARLERDVVRWQQLANQRQLAGERGLSEAGQQAIVFSIAALHETTMARVQVAEADEFVPTLAEAVPWEPAKKAAWLASFHDCQARR